MADRFIFGVAPIDYSPVLLLMPFGFRLATDTLPSGNFERRLQVCLGLFPAFAFVPGPEGAPASPYLPPFPASEELPPLSDTALLIRAPEGLQPS